jgi:hypothetical protein
MQERSISNRSKPDGKLVLIDTRVPDDDASSQVTAVTPGCWKHEGCGWNEAGGWEYHTMRPDKGNALETCIADVQGASGDYYSPYPLSEVLFCRRTGYVVVPSGSIRQQGAYRNPWFTGSAISGSDQETHNAS